MRGVDDSYFKGRVAIVTGSSMGIGKAVACELGASGASVVLNGRNSEKLTECHKELTAKGYDVFPVVADITDYLQCRHLTEMTIEKFGRIDILVNNAGTVGFAPFDTFDPAHYRNSLDSNLYGAVYPTMAALPYLKKSKGSVIFISSLAGLMGMPNYSAYSAGKMALTALSQALRTELAGTGVHIGIVYVSFTQNEDDKKFISADGSLVPVPPRKKWTQQPREKVARSVVKLIRKKRFSTTLSPIGKTYRFLVWLLPGLARNILKKISKNG